ncbi:MAG: hypothetical protein E7384_03795 [Ruminococcaceae bacterium]|nr:hypothetical protein [Oscillospiraceae bacterium]
MKNKNKLVISIVAILVALTAIGGTLAWFFINESSYVDYGSDISCEAGQSLEISIDGGKSWSGFVSNEGFKSSTVDITGDGINMYRPVSIDETSNPTGYQPAVAIDENGVGDFIDIDLMFRTTSKMNVYLNGESYISPTNPTLGGNMFGNFSRDYIAGATRVAFIEVTDNVETGAEEYDLKMIWAPNPKYQLSKSTGGIYTFTVNGSRETYYYTVYEDGEYVKKAYTSDDFATSRFLAGNTGADISNGGESAVLFSTNPAAGEFDYKKMKIRIWFEGTDREASEALAGGKVAAKLKFTGLNKAVPSEENLNALDAVEYDVSSKSLTGVLSGMAFSTDGYTWTAYNDAKPNLPNFDSGMIVYLRYNETKGSLRTDIKKIMIP